MLAGHWAVAVTQPQCERKASEQFHASGFENFFPRIKTVTRRKGVRYKRIDPLFPSYVFVRLAEAWQSIFDMRGINGLLMSGGHPAKLSEDIISSVKKLCNSDGIYTPPPKPKFKTGEAVRMSAGPFSDIKGPLAELRGEDRAIVLLGMFGKVNVAVSDLVAA